ncbi:carboxylate--amine ligase [Anaeromicrobium sediminis]|uniref:Carboxylate--amine ligase n=2 Tax=Anaeromicrobium sediminis TaxID=1478221 RepID=A0A267MKX8_9FIRM|nr:carboxylate--amine ligase [Anaeromicrobium sediminis]
MILGAGKLQLNCIKRAKELGYEVVATDYLTDSPGKKIADYEALADTFSPSEVLREAKRFNVDGILTVGTDQPVLTAAIVSEELGLKTLLDSETAKRVTNKKLMKSIFKKENIPTTNYVEIPIDFQSDEISNLKFPLVVKPADSQGQRGIFKVYSEDELRQCIANTFSYTREDKVILEEYYENIEITVTGWALEGHSYILSVTDRVTFEDDSKIGICVSHEYPTIKFKNYHEEISEVTQKIVTAIGIKEGPLYFQMFIGEEGLKVNEIACRIGGAYEDEFIPHITGVDILTMNILDVMGENIDTSILKEYDFVKDNKLLSIQLFFAKDGSIEKMTDLNKVRTFPGLINAGYNFKCGDYIKPIENATQRAGYAIIEGSTEEELKKNIEYFFDNTKFENDKKDNLIIRGKRGHRY